MITKEQFLAAYNKYQPNAFTKFMFKYFSESTEKKDMMPNKIVLDVLIGLFGFGFFSAILDLSNSLIANVTLAYLAIIVVMFGCISTAAIMNNFRLKKVMKDLGINKEVYVELSMIYFTD